MDRRDVLKAGAALTVSGSGCATLSATPGGDPLGAFLAQLDGLREAIARRPIFEAFRDPLRPEVDAAIQARAELTRKVFRSLTLAGAVGELPPEHRQHPEVQRRVADSLAEMDDAMFGMTEVLEGLTPLERARVGQALREDPNLGMRVMGELDREAAALGASSGMRRRMCTAATQVTSRLRLSPDLAISEYTSKFRRLEARHGGRAEAERQLSASMATSMLWTAETEGSALGGSVGPAQRQCVDNADCGATEVCTDYREVREGEWSLGVCRPGAGKRIKRSPGFLGTGAVALGVALPLLLGGLGGGVAGYFFVTIGALVGLSGLIVLLIGFGFLAGGR